MSVVGTLMDGVCCIAHKHRGKGLKRKNLADEVEGPVLQSVTFALTVSATLNRQSAYLSQVPVELPLAQNCDKCNKRRDQETRVH